MSHRALGLALVTGAVLGAAPFLSRAVPFGSAATSPGLAPAQETDRLVTYTITGRQGRRNREVTGPVLTEVQGVPASPVDSFCYDGEGSEPIKGRVKLEVDPIENTGFVKARWTDEHGQWELTMDFFAHPHHASGLRVAPDSEQRDLVLLDSVVTNAYLHGNTSAGLPVLPTVFTHLALWGPCGVTLNGEPFENQLDGPFKPQWNAHVMVTSGVRGDDGTVRAIDGEIYDPMQHAAMGLSEHEDLEFHLTWHDERYPLNPDNWPPLFDFFYHVVFEDVNLLIRHRHAPGDE